MELATPEQVINLWRVLESEGVYPYEPSEDVILAIAGPQVGLTDVPNLSVQPTAFPEVLQRRLRAMTAELSDRLASIIGTRALPTHVWQPLAATHPGNVFCRFDPTQGSQNRVTKSLGLWAVAPVQVTVGLVPVASTRMAIREDGKLTLIDLRVAKFSGEGAGEYENLKNPKHDSSRSSRVVLLDQSSHREFDTRDTDWCVATAAAYLTDSRIIRSSEVK